MSIGKKNNNSLYRNPFEIGHVGNQSIQSNSPKPHDLGRYCCSMQQLKSILGYCNLQNELVLQCPLRDMMCVTVTAS